MWSGSLISTVLGTQFPVRGTILVDQTLHFARPVTIGDTITIGSPNARNSPTTSIILFDCVCTNQENLRVVKGTAEVFTPEREDFPHPGNPHPGSPHRRQARALSMLDGSRTGTIPTAVAHPRRRILKGPVIAFQEGIIEPILVGPNPR